MSIQFAHLYALFCLALVFFQIALIGGAPWGRVTQGGAHEGALPIKGRIVAALSIPLLLFMALAILSAAGFPGLGWPRWTAWAAVAVQLVSMILNWITPSRIERQIWGPVTTIMAAFALYVVVFGAGA